jgi:two-component system chemotaxis response regulator CheY
MNILIVDDEPGTRLLTAAAVERLGHAALQAGDGEEGLRRFQQERPEVVVTDWSMPGLDGTQLVQRIRADPAPGYTYVILLSGRADEGAAREAARAGADEVLAKPLDAAALERGLIAAERLVGLHRQMLAGASHDPETGAFSRPRMDEDLAALCARVARYGHVYCLAMFEVTPETAAAAAGRSLLHDIRSGDALYRCAPARFVALLPEQKLETAGFAGERLRMRAEAAAGAGATVSCGIVTSQGSECEPAELLARAAAAVAESSASGGGVVGQATGEGTLRLLIADDDPVSRLTMGALVRREAGFALVAEAGDAAEAVDLALQRRPDVVLLDVDMPGGGGARAAVQIREALPDVRIVAISADDSQINQYDMMRAGAVGFLSKGAPAEEVVRVIRSSARW